MKASSPSDLPTGSAVENNDSPSERSFASAPTDDANKTASPHSSSPYELPTGTAVENNDGPSERSSPTDDANETTYQCYNPNLADELDAYVIDMARAIIDNVDVKQLTPEAFIGSRLTAASIAYQVMQRLTSWVFRSKWSSYFYSILDDTGILENSQCSPFVAPFISGSLLIEHISVLAIFLAEYHVQLGITIIPSDYVHFIERAYLIANDENVFVNTVRNILTSFCRATEEQFLCLPLLYTTEESWILIVIRKPWDLIKEETNNRNVIVLSTFEIQMNNAVQFCKPYLA